MLVIVTKKLQVIFSHERVKLKCINVNTRYVHLHAQIKTNKYSTYNFWQYVANNYILCISRVHIHVDLCQVMRTQNTQTRFEEKLSKIPIQISDTGYLTTECIFCMPWCAKGMNVIYFLTSQNLFFAQVLTQAFFQSHFSGVIPSWDFPTTMES